MRIIGETFGKLLVAENALDGGLRVIEIALDRAHVHIGAGLRGHLQLLHLADLAFRIEHGDAGARGVRETSQRGLAGVAGRGSDDHDLLIRVAIRRSGARHETRQNLQRHILERGSRTVEQFHHIVIAERLDRSDLLVGPLRAVRLVDALLELGLGVVRQQHGQHIERDLLVGLAGQGSDIHMGLTQGVGHEQAAIIGDALADGLLGGKRIGGAACAVERGHLISLAIERTDYVKRASQCTGTGGKNVASRPWNGTPTPYDCRRKVLLFHVAPRSCRPCLRAQAVPYFPHVSKPGFPPIVFTRTLLCNPRYSG